MIRGCPIRSAHRIACEELILHALTEAAADGAPCPDNAALARLTGSKSNSGPTDMIMSLERRDLVKVERVSGKRRVTIVATGQSTTALPASRRHRDRNDRSRLVGADRPDMGERLAERPATREPCFRCGVRADVGCAHRAASTPDLPAMMAGVAA